MNEHDDYSNYGCDRCGITLRIVITSDEEPPCPVWWCPFCGNDSIEMIEPCFFDTDPRD